jgi:cbb3-type cytochrome oxidase subunit 3
MDYESQKQRAFLAGLAVMVICLIIMLIAQHL